MAAVSAAHHGFALQRRTRMKTRAANGIATSAMRKSPGAPLILSISGTNNGVRTPDSTPPAATFSRPLRDASVEAIAWLNAHLFSRLTALGRAKEALVGLRILCWCQPFRESSPIKSMNEFEQVVLMPNVDDEARYYPDKP
jgi:hypothetical protein